jgi:rod shape-determining protein MreC
MEASRDDFVIAIRSAFIQRGNKQRFSLFFLLILSIILLILGRYNFSAINYIKTSVKEIVYRSSFIVSVPENYLIDSYIDLKDHFTYYDHYQELKKENKELKSNIENNNYIVSENERLKKIIDDYVIVSDEIIAKVLIDKQSPFLRSIIVNKGSKDNIKLGMAVLDGEFLVGKVVEVNFTTARVLLLSDLNSKIPVTIEPEGYQSILSGTGNNNGIIQYSKEEISLEDGNTVYTSGSGAIFKSGIPVGKIRGKRNVNYLSDFSQLRFVKIISFAKGEN